MEYWIYLLVIAVIVLAAVVLGRTLTFRTRRYAVEPVAGVEIDVDGAAERLSGAVQLQTVTGADPSQADRAPFAQFISYLERSYPAVHATLEREIVGGYSLLYRWKGRDESLKPVLFSAHIDVVPVEEDTEQEWLYPPFSGAVAGGFVWGRGTLDVKIQIIAILEAVEYLLKQNFTPARDFYFAFGHDEEVRGDEGATRLSELFRSRGISFEYVLDEGGCVTVGGISGLDRPVAMVGIGEKGYADIRLTATGEGGHASMPPRHTAAGIIGGAVAALEKRQRPARISPFLKEMLAYIGPEMGFGKRLILANLWLFGGLFKLVFASSRPGNALLRTTTAVTMLEGGSRPNVLPQKASAVINFRIAPWESGQELLDHIRAVAGEKIAIEPLQLYEPSRISPVNSSGFKAVEEAVYAVFPGAVTAPYIVMAGTDAVKYEPVCSQIYRFSPFQINAADLDRIHGTNERISLENIERAIRFFIELLKREP
jgi:carboxypeptidase PM20D1